MDKKTCLNRVSNLTCESQVSANNHPHIGVGTLHPPHPPREKHTALCFFPRLVGGYAPPGTERVTARRVLSPPHCRGHRRPEVGSTHMIHTGVDSPLLIRAGVCVLFMQMCFCSVPWIVPHTIEPRVMDCFCYRL